MREKESDQDSDQTKVEANRGYGVLYPTENGIEHSRNEK